MGFPVYLVDSAARDLADIDDYLSVHDSPKSAEYVLGEIEKVLNTLADFPDRGSYPQELSALGIREYREVYFKPYRIIYRVIGNCVYVYLIADGRRDIQMLLSRRLLDF